MSSKQETKVSENTETTATGNKSVSPRKAPKKNSKKPSKARNTDESLSEENETIRKGARVKQTNSQIKTGSQNKIHRDFNQGTKQNNNKHKKAHENMKGKSDKNDGKNSSNIEANKDAKKQSPQKGASSKTESNSQTKPDNQTKQKASQNSNNSKQKIQDKKGIIPSCIDCKAGSCKPINEKEIKAIVASQRSNGALYYKLKWQDNSTDWYFPCKIPGHLIREYHANRTMSGKKRKKPLHDKQHKFFTKAEPQVNVATKPTESDINQNPVLLAVKIINGRSYYLVKSGMEKPQWQPICMAHNLASDMIDKIFNEREDLLYRLKVQSAINQISPKM